MTYYTLYYALIEYTYALCTPPSSVWILYGYFVIHNYSLITPPPPLHNLSCDSWVHEVSNIPHFIFLGIYVNFFFFWNFQCELTIYITKWHRIAHKYTNWDAPVMFWREVSELLCSCLSVLRRMFWLADMWLFRCFEILICWHLQGWPHYWASNPSRLWIDKNSLKLSTHFTHKYTSLTAQS